MKETSAIIAVSLCVCTGTSFGDIFYDEDQFLGGVDVVYANLFDDLMAGTASSLEYSSGAYSYTITASGSGGGMLSTRDGVVSTTSGLDGILITFTGADVNAVGGNLWATDGEGETIGGYILLELDDGTSELFSATGPQNFRGLATSSAIRSIFIDLPDGDGSLWASMDTLYIGRTVPAPGGLAMVGVAGFAGAARRRKA